LRTNRRRVFVVKLLFTIPVYHDPREVGDIEMIALVALLNVSQPLPWLDRHWINHQARREMLIAASMSSFDPPRPHGAPMRLAMPGRAHLVARAHALLGGPSGM
jgi:hypothetical protein